MAVKILKIVLIVLFVFIVASAIFFAIMGTDTPKVVLVKVEDIHIPQNLDTEKLFGLFFYNDDGSYTRSTKPQEQVNFDPTKPTMIFFHGVQLGMGYYKNEKVSNPVGWLDSGYNVASFFWSQMADFMPNVCVESVWSDQNVPFKYQKDGKVLVESQDTVNYSVTECFVAYYVDFMSQFDYTGEFIHFQGLSLGSNMLSAVCSYLLTLEEAKIIDTNLLPERTTFHDAFLTTSFSNLYVPWLRQEIGESGTLKMFYEVAIQLKNRGIAVEYVASSLVTDMWAISDIGKNYTDEVLFFNFDSSYTADQPLKHVLGKNWYFNVINYDAFYDNSTTEAKDKGIYAVGPNTPISYAYARMDTIYDMETNKTRYDYTDDVIKSRNIEYAKIAGFAFLDSNNNGINDDRLSNRINEISVQLYDGENKLIDTTQTANGGYYQFLIKESDIGKNYYIKIALPDNLGVGKYNETNNAFTDNGIKSNLQSDIVAINEILDLKIINIGLINK